MFFGALASAGALFDFEATHQHAREMSSYCQKTNHDVENINDEDFFEGMKNENREIFKRALSEAVDSKIRKIEEKTIDMEIQPTGKRHKIRMNRLFRERVGGAFLPFPEADNFYERVRSKLVIKLKVNKFSDRRKKRKRIR